MTFEELELDDLLLDALIEQHYHKPTPIQVAAIPPILEGQDVLAGAATGTGKTAAFVLPLLQHLLDFPKPKKHIRALILAPTRELAIQINKVIKQLGTHCDIESMVITGGFVAEKQLAKLAHSPDILVATPGRLMNLLENAENESVELGYIEYLTIDEADRMLDMGQGPSVLAILEATHGEFQANCFSATLGGTGVQRFAADILQDPVVVQIDAPNQQSEQVQQMTYYADSKPHKQAILKAILEDEACQSALIFCNKKERTIELAEWLQAQDIAATELHGDFIQAKRLEKTHQFKIGKFKVMVATDVAARGLDIPNITHVINYDIPIRGDIYIHRIGRTGRGQNMGIAINLVEAHDKQNLQRIEFHTKGRIPVGTIKTLEPKINLAKPKKGHKKPHKKKLAAKAKKAKKPKSKR